MTIDIIPPSLRNRYRFEEQHHACGILASDFPAEWQDILDCLDRFWLKESWIMIGGGGRSQIPREIDGFLQARGWGEKQFDTRILVDGKEYPTPTHRIDNVKNRVGIEVEWNNKTEFYDRDLNNFRLLHELKVLSVGVIITRVSELQALFDELGIGAKYGNSTTHWDKLIPKVNGGGAGGCPLLLVGIGKECYRANK
jgi:hypothetical protein